MSLRQDNGIKSSAPHVKSYAETLSAAESGNAEAQYNVGIMYETGCAVDRNYRETLRWFTLAATQGHCLALVALGEIYSDLYPGPLPTSMPQIYRVGLHFRYSLHYGVNYPDRTKAINFFQQAAQQGHADAAFYLGFMLYYTSSAEARIEKQEAIKWFLHAAMQKHIGALYQLSCLQPVKYREIRGAFLEEEKAFLYDTSILRDYAAKSLPGSHEQLRWLKEAAGQHDIVALYRLGEFYQNLLDPKKKYFEMAAPYFCSASLEATLHDELHEYGNNMAREITGYLAEIYAQSASLFRRRSVDLMFYIGVGSENKARREGGVVAEFNKFVQKNLAKFYLFLQALPNPKFASIALSRLWPEIEMTVREYICKAITAGVARGFLQSPSPIIQLITEYASPALPLEEKPGKRNGTL